MNVLKSGKLPAPATIIQEQVVGPSLGAKSIRAGMISFLIAFLLVLIYMIFFYQGAGVAADIALLCNVLLLFGVLVSFGAVLTLPGIAGLVLTMGMAVDANVIIYERIKEELAAGKGLSKAVSDGYKNAYSAIIDGQVTTLLTGIVLFIFGSGPVQGFATTLIIGIITSVLTSIFITRLIFDDRIKKGKNITFVVDESFADFATGFGSADDITLLHDEILDKYKKLVVVKSISKSFGVPGFRLGVLASGNRDLIASLKKEVAIWNINSFGEFYMQIYEKYKKNYLSSLEKHGKARDILVDGLKSIPYLKVFPSQANFIMCEVTGGKKSLELCAEILVEEDILIKDLSSKVGNGKQYIRIAVRDEADNARLIEALKRH